MISGVCLESFVEKLSKFNTKVKIHLEIETGMGRNGIKLNSLSKFINIIPSNVVVEGIYKHLSSANTDFLYTKKQIIIFKDAVKIAKDKLKTNKIFSCFCF